MSKNSSADVVSGFSWKLVEKLLNYGANLVITIVLARLLLPDDYGTIALVNVFILIANVFVVNGVGVALIQDRDADDAVISTDFIIGILLGMLLYGILYFAAVPIAAFYSNELIIPIVRVLGLKIPFSSVYNVLYGVVAKRMLFKKLFLPSVTATIISGTAGILMAYQGWGIWALVAQTVINEIVLDAGLLWSLNWKIRFSFRKGKAAEHLAFSMKVIAGELVNTLVSQLNSLLIGKLYSPADLAYYDNGIKYPQAVIGMITDPMNAVMLPAIANARDTLEETKALVSRAIRSVSFFVSPLMIGFAVCAEYAVEVLLTAKWLPSVPYLRIICVIFLMMPVNSVNYQAVKAIGRAGLFLRLQIIKTVFNILIILLAYRHGMMAIALSGLVSNVITALINAYPTHRYLGYTVFEQIADLVKYWLYSLPFVAVLTVFNHFVNASPLIMLICNVLIGAVVYIATAFMLKSEEFHFALNVLKTRKGTKA